MINFLIGLIAFILMLGLIVVIHELGHYLAARFFGVHCHEFSIGMGPALYQRQGKNTLFSIRAFPIGGYVSIAGENAEPDEDEDELDKDSDLMEEEEPEEDWLSKVPENERLNHKPAWQQVIVLVAGVVMNVLLALVLMTTVFAVRGYVPTPAEPVIADVLENSAAQKADLKPGDRIVRIEAEDGSSVEPETLLDVQEFLMYNHGESLYTIERDGETFETKMTPTQPDPNSSWQLGFTANAGVRFINPFEAIGAAWNELWDDTAMIFRSLGQLVQGKGVESLSGPVGIYKTTDQIVSMGFWPYVTLCALISLNIGIFNLLPIPALDGGRIVILLGEKLFRRKLSRRAFEYIVLGSYVVLLGILIFATYNDIMRFFM